MSRRPPVSTRTDTLFPFTALRRAESRPPCLQAAARDFAVVRRDREHHRPRSLFRGRPEAEAARCRIAPSRICREWPALSRWLRAARSPFSFVNSLPLPTVCFKSVSFLLRYDLLHPASPPLLPPRHSFTFLPKSPLPLVFPFSFSFIP